MRSRTFTNNQMNFKKVVIGIFGVAFLLASCNQEKQEIQSQISQTSVEVQKIIDELGVVYVEKGATTIITYDEVNVAQHAWCDALVKIGEMKKKGEDYRAFAEQVLSNAYNYDNGKVFFKPTLAYSSQTFRNDKKGALAYFAGGDPTYPNDKGFALTPWVKASYDNAGDKMKEYRFMVQ